jgi:hypothetical protein
MHPSRSALIIRGCYMRQQLITVVARYKAWTIFSRSNTEIEGSNPTRSMGVCVRLFCVCGVLCVGRGLPTDWSPVQGVLPTVHNFSPLWRYSPSLGLGLPPRNSPFHFGLLDLRHSVGLLGRVITSSQGLYLYTNTEKRTRAHIHKTPNIHARSGDSNPRSWLPSERRQCMS